MQKSLWVAASGLRCSECFLVHCYVDAMGFWVFVKWFFAGPNQKKPSRSLLQVKAHLSSTSRMS